MEFEYYFDPVKAGLRKAYQRKGGEGRLGNSVAFYKKGGKPLTKGLDVAIIGVGDCVNSTGNPGCAKAPDAIRDNLYGLRVFDRDIRIADMGNIRGKTTKDKIFALTEACSFLMENSVIPVILGGSQDFTIALADALSRSVNEWNLSLIDSSIDHVKDADELTSGTFLTRLFSVNKDRIDNITLIAAQKYLYTAEQEKFFADNYFNILRLGEIKGDDLKKAEPMLRDTDILSLDVSAVKKADMPAQSGAMPNGLFSHEVCQLAWYAGISDRLKGFGLFELDTDNDDSSGSGGALAAQMIWYFIEGLSMRFGDYPLREIETYSIYIVHLEDYDLDIRFFNNPQNERWWVEVPGKDNNIIVPCSKDDYDNALKNEMPEKWIFFTKKSGSKSGSKNDSLSDIG